MTNQSKTGTSKKISIISPVFNEEQNIDEFLSNVEEVLNQTHFEYEIICVNDGSTDSTYQRLQRYRSRSRKIKTVDLARNFGKEIALSAGLDYATGEAVIIMDADLQHPAEMIPKLLEKWGEGFEGVYGIRVRRGEDSVPRRFFTKLFYKLLQKIGEVPIPPNAGDFRLLDRRVVDALLEMPERTRFMKGLYAWVGFHQTGVEYVAQERASGKSRWSMFRLWSLAVEGLVSFSSVPLKIWSYVGFIISMLALLYAVIVVIDVLLTGAEIPGIPSILTAVFFLGGIQLLTIGILGEYLSRIFVEVKRRPVYVVREVQGVDLDEVKTVRARRNPQKVRSD